MGSQRRNVGVLRCSCREVALKPTGSAGRKPAGRRAARRDKSPDKLVVDPGRTSPGRGVQFPPVSTKTTARSESDQKVPNGLFRVPNALSDA